MAKSDKLNISEEDVAFILSNRPDPNLMTIAELAAKYKTTPGIIYGIWQRSGLPTDKLRPRKRDLKPKDIKEIRNLIDAGKEDLEIADELLIVKRYVSKERKTYLKESRQNL